MSDLTQSVVAAAFRYDSDRGVLVWRVRPETDFSSKNAWAVWNSKHAGTDAGWISAKGYRTIRFKDKCRKASRLIWVLVIGVEPDRIDHTDGDTLNDRVENLRDVSQAVNSRNKARQSNNKSGASGVYLSSSGKWIAQIDVAGRRRYLGSYEDKDDAILVRSLAAAKAGFHPNHDRSRTGGRND